MTTSSKAVFPARSPMPFIVHFYLACTVNNTRDRILLLPSLNRYEQWQDRIAFSIPFTFSRKYLIFAPIFFRQTIACSIWDIKNGSSSFNRRFHQIRAKNSFSVLPASSA